jgi:predicted site-specific integrase-resolvase
MQSTNGHEPKRAILYARVSTEEQVRSGYSLGQQMEALREYTARVCYGPTPRTAVAWRRNRQANATKCNPAKVSGSLS